MQRLSGLALAGLLALAPAAWAQKPEKASLAIGTASLALPYIPLIVADRLGYFKDEGLTVEISAFSGGSKALEALLGGSLDMVSGAYSNSLTMAAKNQKLVVFAQEVRCPGFALAVSKRRAAGFQGPQDMKGWTIGVSAPGSSTHMVLNYILAKAGIAPTDVSIVGVGTAAGAVAAVRAGQVDAVLNNDPVITMLLESGDAINAVDMRTPETSNAVFGGPYPEASVYSTAAFIAKNPRTVQAVTNAVVRAERWMAAASPEQIAGALPEEYLLGNKALYLRAMGNMRGCYSPDGLMTKEAGDTVLKVLGAFEENVRNAKINVEATYDNSFVLRVPASPVAK